MRFRSGTLFRSSAYHAGLSHRHPPETRMKPITRRGLAAVAMALAAAGVGAQDIQEHTIKFGHLNNPGHPTSLGVKKFAEIVLAKSGGKIKVQEFPSSQLGNELQQQSALQGGVQEMLVASTT